MKNIDEILNKYWEGESSFTEEDLLRNELTDISSENAIAYTTMKQAFHELKELSIDNQLNADFFIHLEKQKHKRKIYLHAGFSFAASAAIAIGLFLFSYNKEAVVVENGIKHENMEMAVQYADQAINEALYPLKASMQSLEPIKGLEGSLLPTIKEKIEQQTNSIFKSNDSLNFR